MRLDEAYKLLTDDRKRLVNKDIIALLQNRELTASELYVNALLNGSRSHPCSKAVAKVVATYFRGELGLNISDQDVRDSFKSPKPRAAANDPGEPSEHANPVPSKQAA